MLSMVRLLKKTFDPSSVRQLNGPGHNSNFNHVDDGDDDRGLVSLIYLTQFHNEVSIS